jgi:hypothetical protein
MAPPRKHKSSDMPPPPPPKRQTRSGGSNIQGTNPSNRTPSSEDFNKRTRKRTVLLTRLKRGLKDKPVTPAFWACCQLGDAKALEDIVHVAERRAALISVLDTTAHLLTEMCKSLGFQSLLRLCLTVNMLTLYRDPGVPRFSTVAIKGILN